MKQRNKNYTQQRRVKKIAKFGLIKGCCILPTSEFPLEIPR